MKIKVLGTEAACGTSTTNGSNFGSSTAVRLVNSGTTDRLVSVETSANVLIGTFTLKASASDIVEKDASDEIFAANAEVLGVGVAQTS
ncbi:uncharacterized protein METZ01_LOCUS164994 [marine metagenome]|uniref:Uncharacterized protein n=1 Tax=marine metagenome TaxID=408172 RepID=A0A382BE55_9ZZZZ